MSFPKFFKKPVDVPMTVGERLKVYRRRKRLRITDVVSRLKIRQEYLEALEANEYSQLPGPIYAKQFLKAYAEFLGLDAEPLARELKPLWYETVHGQSLLLTTMKESNLFITPKLIFGGAILMLVTALIGYFGWQIRLLNSPPKLVVDEPADGAHVITKTVDIVGQTSPGSVVSINNEPVAQQIDGHFRQSIQINEGVNELMIVARNRFNKETTRQISIIKPQGEGQVGIISNHPPSL
jgi:transcriptional regulator with XRE-family HTH domain